MFATNSTSGFHIFVFHYPPSLCSPNAASSREPAQTSNLCHLFPFPTSAASPLFSAYLFFVHPPAPLGYFSV